MSDSSSLDPTLRKLMESLVEPYWLYAKEALEEAVDLARLALESLDAIPDDFTDYESRAFDALRDVNTLQSSTDIQAAVQRALEALDNSKNPKRLINMNAINYLTGAEIKCIEALRHEGNQPGGQYSDFSL